MLIPLYVLAARALVAGYFGYRYFVGHEALQHFWREALKVLPEHKALKEMHHVPEWVGLAPLAAGVSGLVLSSLFYGPWQGLPALFARTFGPIYQIGRASCRERV